MTINSKYGVIPGLGFLVVFYFCYCPSIIAQEISESKDQVSIPDPKALVAKDAVPLTKTTRTFREEKFRGLQKRYQTIAGIVMIGITNNKQEVLLKGPDRWAPLGGAVEPGEDWPTAARRIALEQTGQQISVRAPVLVEQMRFELQDNPRTYFSAFLP